MAEGRYVPAGTPRAATRVQLYSRATNRMAAEVYTDARGFYYVQLVPGAYFVRIAGAPDVELTVWPARTGYQFQDVPRIVVRVR